MVFKPDNTDKENWEPRISKLDKCLRSWKGRSLSLIRKVLILNILGLSKLFFLASVLTPLQWVYDRINPLTWPFLWGSPVETVARRSLICPITEGGLGLRDFWTQGQASRLALLINTVSNTALKGFFIVKYFCGSQLASCRRSWSSLRDNATPSALSPTIFYSPLLTTIRDLEVPETFSNTAKDFYALLLRKICTSPILHRSFSLTVHWQRVRDNFTENFTNDLAWLISLQAVKVRDSIRNWGYIDSSRCASCPRVETIIVSTLGQDDHCFLNRRRVRPVWLFFLPLVTSLLGSPFTPNCAFVFLYQFSPTQRKNSTLIIFY